MAEPACWYCRKPVADVEVEGWSSHDAAHVVVYACVSCLPVAYLAIPQPRRSVWRTQRGVPKHRSDFDQRMEREFLTQISEYREGRGAA